MTASLKDNEKLLIRTFTQSKSGEEQPRLKMLVYWTEHGFTEEVLLLLLYENGTANAVAQLGKVVDELHGCCNRPSGDGILDDLVFVVVAGTRDQGTR
jgi:hypothetical protein